MTFRVTPKVLFSPIRLEKDMKSATSRGEQDFERSRNQIFERILFRVPMSVRADKFALLNFQSQQTLGGSDLYACHMVRTMAVAPCRGDGAGKNVEWEKRQWRRCALDETIKSSRLERIEKSENLRLSFSSCAQQHTGTVQHEINKRGDCSILPKPKT